MKNVYMRYIRVTEGKIENLKKEGKMRISTLIFIYTIHFAYLKVYVTAHILTVHIFHQLVLLFKNSIFMQLLMGSDISSIFSKQC